MNVFVSHSRQNASLALALRERLRALKFNVWVDVADLSPGSNWKHEIEQALERANGIIILLGPEQSPDDGQRIELQQIAEHEYFLDPNKPIIPVVLGSAELPGFLRSRHSLTVDPSAPDLHGLTSAIQRALEKPSETVDHEQLERGLAARQKALENLKEYSRELERADVKNAAVRGLK